MGVIIRHPRHKLPLIVGIQDTGSRSTDGATLKQVSVSAGKLRETSLGEGLFDSHPSYQFPEWVDSSGNYFRKIPICYWWRGNLPAVAGNGTGDKWTMLISPEPIRWGPCSFTANPGAFKRNGEWLPRFYYGTYRGHNAGSSKVGSAAGQTHWGNVSFDNFRTYCANNGAGYHLGSLFEWQEILARMVIEKGTFQLFPESVRATQSSCQWRGIQDMAFSGTVYAEWMDGVRTDASGKYELWDQAEGSYVTTEATAFNGSGESTYYNQGILSGGGFDNLFLASTMGAAATSFIPDFSGRTNSYVSRVCFSRFYASNGDNGAFCSSFYYASSAADAAIGGRLAKW